MKAGTVIAFPQTARILQGIDAEGFGRLCECLEVCDEGKVKTVKSHFELLDETCS